MQVQIHLNGTDRSFDVHPGTLLIELLRSDGLFSVKHSDETGDSGNDGVLIDGVLINSSIYLAAQAHKRSVMTVEALGTPENLHPIQVAFVETGAIQCGYCTPAMILSAYELIANNPEPGEAEVRDALSGILCRCTGYAKPVEAILLAARRMKEEGHGISGGRQEDPPGRRHEVSLR